MKAIWERRINRSSDRAGLQQVRSSVSPFPLDPKQDRTVPGSTARIWRQLVGSGLSGLGSGVGWPVRGSRSRIWRRGDGRGMTSTVSSRKGVADLLERQIWYRKGRLAADPWWIWGGDLGPTATAGALGQIWRNGSPQICHRGPRHCWEQRRDVGPGRSEREDGDRDETFRSDAEDGGSAADPSRIWSSDPRATVSLGNGTPGGDGRLQI